MNYLNQTHFLENIDNFGTLCCNVVHRVGQTRHCYSYEQPKSCKFAQELEQNTFVFLSFHRTAISLNTVVLYISTFDWCINRYGLTGPADFYYY